jgi:NTP pyrophosphatase (non-canonical NTP hydrolase)
MPEPIKAAMNARAPSITETICRLLAAPGELSFRAFSAANRTRCETAFHPLHDWSATDWACALGGECGELLNKIKKRRRGEYITDQEIADEAGDIVAYLDLLLQREGIDLAAAVHRKFNRVSERIGSEVKL